MEDKAMLMRRTTRNVPDLINIFDDFFGGDFFTSPVLSGYRSIPAVNVRETDDEYAIEVAAPGFSKDDFKVEYHNGVLTISSEKEEKNEDKGKGYCRKEFNYSSFSRSFSVPSTQIDDSKIGAVYKDGILNVTLHKREEVKPKPARMIAIK